MHEHRERAMQRVIPTAMQLQDDEKVARTEVAVFWIEAAFERSYDISPI